MTGNAIKSINYLINSNERVLFSNLSLKSVSTWTASLVYLLHPIVNNMISKLNLTMISYIYPCIMGETGETNSREALYNGLSNHKSRIRKMYWSWRNPIPTIQVRGKTTTLVSG